MPYLVDEPRDVRPGEELDAARLEAYLKAQLPALHGPLSIRQFPSGFSNLTYQLRVGAQDFVLRRPPFGSKVKTAHDMTREFRVLRALHPVYPPAPEPLLFCDDPEVIGAPFYLMERIPGVILRARKPEGFDCTPALARQCCVRFVENLVQLHAVDYAAIGLADMHREGWFVKRQVEGWVQRYAGSQTDDIPAITQVAEYLQHHCPPDSETTFIHNDYKFDNIVLDADGLSKIVGVLDWEMCTIGDPLLDLGVVLSYWNEPKDPSLGLIPCFLTHEPGCMTRREVVDEYARLTGRAVGNIAFYYVFGLLKLAVIAQQIYFRYKQGLTQDPRFAPLIFVVGALGMMGVKTLETGEI